MTFSVRPATDADWPMIWPIIQEVAASEESFAMEAAPNERVVRASWMTKHPGRRPRHPTEEGQVLGTANMYANRPNQGARVASLFMVAASARGRGVGRALVRDMIVWATDHRLPRHPVQRCGRFDTEGAVRLYETEGFRVIGTATRRSSFTPCWVRGSPHPRRDLP